MGKWFKEDLGLTIILAIMAVAVLTGCNKNTNPTGYGYGYGNYACPNPGGSAVYPQPIAGNFVSQLSGQNFSINFTFLVTQQNSLAINVYSQGVLPDLSAILQGYPLQNNNICLSNVNSNGGTDAMTSWLDPNTGIRGVEGNVYGSYQLSSSYGAGYGGGMYGGYGGMSPYGYNPSGSQTGPTITGNLGQACQTYVIPNVRLVGCLTLTINAPGVYGSTTGQPITYQAQ